MLLQHLEANNLKLPLLNDVTIGGSAVPRVMLEKFERDYDVSVKHAGYDRTLAARHHCQL